MAPLRIRHALGTSTIDIDLDNGTVLELQQEIKKVTNILPSLQDVKTGFPPRSITLISELPIASLGLKRGDQLIISELKPTATTTAPAPTPASSSNPAPSRSSNPISTGRPQGPPPQPKPAPKFIEPTQTSNDAQPSMTAQPPVETPSAPAEEIQTPSGVVVHRVVPDDNSCLFSSIGIVFEQDMAKAQALRQVVVDAIKSDSIQYDEATLGRTREEYMQTILKPATWGGAIELSIFSSHYKTEITSIDIETGRCDRFGEGQYSIRVILLYSGIHYDAVSVSPIPNAPVEFHTTIFPISDQHILQGAQKLADKLRAGKKFTNTATFDLRCEVCKIGIKGEKEAREHAKVTGHQSFGEY
ncbi:ubiquitin-specific protease otu1 [Serendipita sp. 407]|nr:ubiquitin-specific protease otu1 [Serendipita sp. 407]